MAGRLLLAATFAFSSLLGDAFARPGRKGDYIGIAVANPDIKDAIPHRYIVVYNNTFQDDEIEAHQLNVVNTIQKRNYRTTGARTGRLLSTKVDRYRVGSLRAMVLEADDLMINTIFEDPAVEYIEQDAKVSLNVKVVQVRSTTGLGRLSHENPGNRSYVFDASSGDGMTAYIVDTGIRVTHKDFGGRAEFAANFVTGSPDDDENGHGTHVAGTVGGAKYGVAKNIRLLAVKVLDANGEGSNSGVIAGMNFVARHAAENELGGKAIMNMSLGGARSNAVNRAINSIADAGVVPIVAAGNENQDTANTSPGSAPRAITVGAIDQTTDERASFSNFGAGVDIFAPGVNVLSCGIADDEAEVALGGTSMASPHVAGLAAYLMALEGVTGITAVSDRIKELAAATTARIPNQVPGTTTLIANNGVRL